MENHFNIQKGDKIQLTINQNLPHPVNPNDPYPLVAGHPYEFVRFTDDDRAEIIYLTNPELRTFVPADIILPYTD